MEVPEKKEKEMKKIKASYDVKKLQYLLGKWDWDFQDRTHHPERTCNCGGSGHEVSDRISGDLNKGHYANARFCCSHCYPGSNAAKLEWDVNKNLILLTWEDGPTGAGGDVFIPTGEGCSSKPRIFAKIFGLKNPQPTRPYDL
ncbi:MAG: hypothetical protein ACPGO5_00050 [Patescibacteria group bacterium]